MITYLLINDETNKMIHTTESSVSGFRQFGKYYDGKQISPITDRILSTLAEDIEMLCRCCELSF